MSAPLDLKARLQQPFDRELVQAEVARAAVEERAPFNWKQPGAPSVRAPIADDVLTSGDLTLDLLPEGVEFPVTIRGRVKKVWVHAISDQDQLDIMRWTMRRDDGSEPKSQGELRLKQQELIQIAHRFQVIACCRTGPRRDAQRCFLPEDFAAIGGFMPRAVIGEIVSLSERLTGGGEAIGGGVRRFFGVILTCLRISASVSGSSENCPAGFADILAACESLASRGMKDGIWDSSMSEMLERLETWQQSLTNS